jgi:hypothetical protein
LGNTSPFSGCHYAGKLEEQEGAALFYSIYLEVADVAHRSWK